MRIQALILATLIGCDDKSDTGTTGGADSGYDTCYGTPMVPYDFTLSTSLDSKMLSYVMSQHSVTDPETLTCEQVCEYMVNYEAFADVNSIDTCTHSVDAKAETAEVSCTGSATTYCEGRRPLGHIEADTTATLGGFLAHCAHLEAASVVAFEQLARQLYDLGAPKRLIARCLVAADEERDHARAMSMLARRHGAAVPPVHRLPVNDDIEVIAMHNAIEGCVSETWAALAAGWKGRHATSPTLRAAYTRIAIDEMRHAQLAWDLHDWLMEQLSAEARQRVEEAQARAIAALPDMARRQARQMPAELGMPSAQQAAAMAARFGQGLLAA